MPATAVEKFRGASGDLTTHNITYLVEDAVDDIDALQAVDAAAPVTYDGLTKDNFRYTELRWPDVWEVEVSYTKKTRQPPETGSTEYAFDVSLDSVHVLQSLETIATYGDTTDFKQAINVDIDGNAQGIDIRVPIGSFEISYYPVTAFVSSAYQKTVQETVGKVNSATFNGHAAGEVLFVGCSGKARNVTDWELSYRFEVRRNRTGLVIGDITGIAVDGWDVLWVYYERSTDNNKYIQNPVQVNVERVYDRVNFSTALGI